MRVWIVFLLALIWTSCDSVRYGSIPCENEECEASLSSDSGSKDKTSKDDNSSKDNQSKDNSSKDGKNGKDNKDSRENKDNKDKRDTVKTGKDNKDTANVHKPATDTVIVGHATCRDGVIIDKDAKVTVESADAAKFRRTGVSLSGFAEKGPFRAGTSVKLVELDSAKRLADSERSHETCITSSNGKFNLEKINFVSPYVRAEANGFYMDEFTAKPSQALVTLRAVVDLSKRDSFNVNMLTHMAAPRVLKLVEDSGNNQPIGSQSGRALTDVLSSFGITIGGSTSGGRTGGSSGWGGRSRGQTTQSSSTKSAEDISLFGSDDYSAALLAITVMMQSYGSVSEMLSFADKVAEDIRGDGNWGDNSLRSKLADKLLMLDAEGGFDKIRKNMEGWKIGNVPDFEKYVRSFWTKTHGFETCGSMNAGQVKHVGNSQSEYFVSYYDQPEGTRMRFICDKLTKNWRVATDIEKDTVGFGAGEYDGQYRTGKINRKKYYVYEQRKRSWREAAPGEIVDFIDVEEVLKELAAGEKVIFILRHAERTDDTGKTGHLTDNGKKQSQKVGTKFKDEDIYFANSTFTRSYETCSSFATGAGVSLEGNDTIPELDGEWFIKDDSKFENYKNSNGGGWVVTSEYAFKGSYSDAFYPLASRGEEFVTEVVKPRFEKVNKVAVWISHDMLVVPLAAYCTERKINLRYFETKRWVNYLAGVAFIMGADGSVRYVPVRGLDSGTMTM